MPFPRYADFEVPTTLTSHVCLNRAIIDVNFEDVTVDQNDFILKSSYVLQRHTDRWLYSHDIIENRCWPNQLNSSASSSKLAEQECTYCSGCSGKLQTVWETFNTTPDPYAAPLPGSCRMANDRPQGTRQGERHVGAHGEDLALGHAGLLLVHELNSAPVVLTDQEEILSGGNSARLFSGLFQSAQSQSWLEDWLWHLQVEIPTISDKKGGFNLTVSNGLCTHFKIAKIDTVKNPSNLQITASGLEIFCRLRWDAKSRLLPDLGGEVVAQVSNAELGGPISIVSDGLQPPLPKAINAHGCSGTIKAEFTFTGSGVSTVLEFLKPLIQSIINDRLAELICSNLDQVLEDQGSEALLNASGEVRKILRESPTPPPTPVIEDPKKELIDFGENSGMDPRAGFLGENTSDTFCLWDGKLQGHQEQMIHRISSEV
ncbi:Hypothetical protein SCF082_LOCUS30387 [Durusdinium trenchii]|uniref:SMP-LTD domain-containing protein n=1 Tax=Durusdinium trenchii TaxID=1381693 RepID=A0ABP0MYE4_9DINO